MPKTLNQILTEGKGTYSAVTFSKETNKKISDFSKSLGVEPIEDLHSTLLFSRKYLPNYKAKGEINETAKHVGWEMFDSQDDKKALVMVLSSDFLQTRHNVLMKEHGATWDYPEYIPHCTLSYDYNGDIPTELLDEVLNLVNEYQEDLDLDWVSKKI